MTGGNETHTVKIVRDDQTDLLGATVSVNIVGGIDGIFLYSALSALVILEARNVLSGELRNLGGWSVV